MSRRVQFLPWQVWLVDLGVPAGNDQLGALPEEEVSNVQRWVRRMIDL